MRPFCKKKQKKQRNTHKRSCLMTQFKDLSQAYNIVYLKKYISVTPTFTPTLFTQNNESLSTICRFQEKIATNNDDHWSPASTPSVTTGFCLQIFIPRRFPYALWGKVYVQLKYNVYVITPKEVLIKEC